MKLEVKQEKNNLLNFDIPVSRIVSLRHVPDGAWLRTFKIKYNKEVKSMAVTSEFYWNIFQNTGSPLAYLLYKEETST